MVRGVVPRQPAKGGRQEGVRRPAQRVAGTGSKKVFQARVSRGGVRATPSPKDAKRPVKAARGYDPLAPERIREVLRRLDEHYPRATCALHHKTAWELLVATILSAQCTDARVNMVTPVLFERYPTPQDFAALKPEQLEPDIRSTGFFRNKSKSLVGAAKKLVSEFGGQVPDDMEMLLSLPGVARKTANVVLGTWFRKATGIVVDTHVRRIARRIELTKNQDPEKIEQDLMRIVPPERWIDFSHQLIHHGRQICLARSPRCAECPLEDLCHAADKTWTAVEIHKWAKP
jgi:endonuclease-3